MYGAVPPLIVPLIDALAPLSMYCESVVSVGIIAFTCTTERVFEIPLATAAKRLFDTTGEKATPSGAVPTVNGEVDVWVNAPVDVFTVYVDTVVPAPLPSFVTMAYKLPLTNGENATELGPAPVEKGDPGTAVNAPVVVFTE